MRELNFKKAALVASLALVMLGASSASAQSTDDTDVDLEIVPGIVTIDAPALLDFGTGQVATTTGSVELDLSTYSGGTLYFEVEDLRGDGSGYNITLDIGNLTVTGTSKQIDATNVYIDTDNTTNTGTAGELMSVETGITKLDGLVTPPQVIPPEVVQATLTYNGLNAGGALLADIPTIISRDVPTTPDSGILGRYGVQPTITIEVPKFQELGQYEAVMTMTLTEAN